MFIMLGINQLPTDLLMFNKSKYFGRSIYRTELGFARFPDTDKPF